MKHTHNLLKLLIIVLLLSTKSNDAQNQFKWQGAVSSSWANSLNWQVWNGSAWVTNTFPTFPNSTTHTVTIDFTGLVGSARTVSLDVTTAGVDVASLDIINNDATFCQLKFLPVKEIKIYSNFFVSGTNTSSISINCAIATGYGSITGFGDGSYDGGGKLIFTPTNASQTITPVFANATYSNICIEKEGDGVMNITENNLKFQSFRHFKGTLLLNGNTLNLNTSFYSSPRNVGDLGLCNIENSTINVTHVTLGVEPPTFSLSASTTTFNLISSPTLSNTIYSNFKSIYLVRNSTSTVVTTVSTINSIDDNILEIRGSSFSSKLIALDKINSNSDIQFKTGSTAVEFRVRHINCLKPLTISTINASKIQNLNSITTATSLCSAAYNFIGLNGEQAVLETDVPITVNNMNFRNVRVNSGSIITNNAVDMGFNTGVIFNSPITSGFGTTTLTWNGTVSNKWNNPNNWTPSGCVPNILTNVVIPSGTPNSVNVANCIASCYHLTTTGTPTILAQDRELLIGGNFTISNSSIFNFLNTNTLSYPNTGSIYFLGLLANTNYSIITNGTELQRGSRLVLHANNTSKYTLMDDLTHCYTAGQSFQRHILLLTGTFDSNGKTIKSQGIFIGNNNNALSTLTVNISNSTLFLKSSSAGGRSLSLDCRRTNTLITTNSHLIIEPPIASSLMGIYCLALPVNNGTNTPSFKFNKVTFLPSTTDDGYIYFSAANNQATVLDGLKFQSIKLYNNLRIENPNTARRLLITDSLFIAATKKLTITPNNTITVTTHIGSDASCVNGMSNIESVSTGTTNTDMAYIQTTNTPTYSLNYFNIDGIRVNQQASGLPAITVNNTDISPRTQPSTGDDGWNGGITTSQLFYWVGEGATTNWNDLDNWSYSLPTNGDEPTAGCLPSKFDDVVFTKLSFFGNTGSAANTTSLVTISNDVASFRDMRWSGPFTTTSTGTTVLMPEIVTTHTTSYIECFGSIRMHKTMKWNFGLTGINEVRFLSSGQDSIEVQNNHFKTDMYFMGNGKYTIVDSLCAGNAGQNITLPSQLKTGRIIHFDGHIDAKDKKIRATGFNNIVAANNNKQSSIDITNAHVWLNLTGSNSSPTNLNYFFNNANATYTFIATNSSIYAVRSSSYLHDGAFYFNNNFTNSPRFQFNNLYIKNLATVVSSFTIANTGGGYKGLDIDTLVYDVNVTDMLNTVASQTTNINYLKYKLGSINTIEDGAVINLGKLDVVSFCDPTIIQSSNVGQFTYICPTNGTLQAQDASLKYINSACGTYSATNYSKLNGTLASFVPTGQENTYGWSVNTSAVPFGFLINDNASPLCSALPYNISTTEFNTSATTHTLVWQTPSGTFTGSPTGTDLTVFSASVSGVYTLTTTYKTGCSVTDTYTINAINDINAISSQTNVSCNSFTNGAAVLAVTPSTIANAFYQYNTNANTYTTSTLTNLGAGVYNYTVNSTLNPSQCKSIGSFTITQPTVLAANANITASVACFGASTASLSSSPTGGNGGNSYIWADGTNTYTTQNISSVSAGTYSLTVTDNKNCVATTTLQVNEPLSALTTSINNTTQAGCGLSNGSVTLTTTGGTSAYTYSWVPTSATGYTTVAATNGSLSIGTTSIYVIDANGCVTTASVSITNPNAPALTSTVTNIICYGTNTGAIATDVISSSACTYTWSNNTFSADLSGVGAGVYTITIQDANLCVSTQTIAIAQPSVSFGLQVANVISACLNQTNGSATVTVSGGTPVYNYTWQPTNTNSNVLTNAPIGNYTVFATDANGCLTNTVVNLALNTNPVLASLNAITTATCEQSNGSVLINVAGGTPQYSYQWLPNNVTTQNLENVSAGTYTVVVTDNTGCVDTLAISLTCKVPLFIPEFLSPNGNGKNETFEIKGIENFPNNTVSIFNRWGSLVYSKKQYDNTFNGKANVSNAIGNGILPAGTYFIVIDFGDNGTTKAYNGYLELRY